MCSKRLRLKRKKAGICIECETPSLFLLCDFHRKRDRDNKTKKRKLRIKLGLCTDCGDIVEDNKSRCEIHLKTSNKASKKYRMNNVDTISKSNKQSKNKYKIEGRCSCCSAPLDYDIDVGFLTCFNCRTGSFNGISLFR